MKVVITTSSFGRHSIRPLALLENAGWEVTLNPFGRKLTESEALSLYEGHDAVIAGTEPVTANVISANPTIRFISRMGVGLDNVDLEAARSAGIPVTATTVTPAPAVAELVLAFMFDLARHMTAHASMMRSSEWEKRMGGLVSGGTLGIIGLGTIGRTLADLATGLSRRVIGHDPFVSESDWPDSVERLPLEDLLETADFVSLHVPATEETTGMVDAAFLARMKSSAFLINTARGELVDEAALLEAIQQNFIAGAGLDVFLEEPYSGPLASEDRVICTPHVGSYARDIRIAMEENAVTNLLHYFQSL